MKDERNQDYGDVESHITIHTSGHQISQARGGWEFALALLVVTLIVIIVAMVLVFGVIVIRVAAEVFAAIVDTVGRF